jgi:uncharacterized 2Fe-2S/4Fe-4S cluster protein (DUF4445 family)
MSVAGIKTNERVVHVLLAHVQSSCSTHHSVIMAAQVAGLHSAASHAEHAEVATDAGVTRLAAIATTFAAGHHVAPQESQFMNSLPYNDSGVMCLANAAVAAARSVSLPQGQALGMLAAAGLVSACRGQPHGSLVAGSTSEASFRVRLSFLLRKAACFSLAVGF